MIKLPFLALGLALLIPDQAPAANVSSPQSLSSQLKDSLARVKASCVAVNVGGYASGVLISPEGLVLTAAHVMRHAKEDQKITITLEDGRTAEAELLGLNRETDYALLRITSPSEEAWPHCPLADSAPTTGGFCFTAAHPSGLLKGRPAQVRIGRITSHSTERERPFYLIADCNIQPGDSGGPLFSMDGELIGLDSSAANLPGFNIFPAIDQYHLDKKRLLAGERWGDDTKAPDGETFTTVNLDSDAVEAVQKEFMRRVEINYPPTVDFAQSLADENGQVALDSQAIVDHMAKDAISISRKQDFCLGLGDPAIIRELAPLPDGAAKAHPVYAEDQRIGFGLAVSEKHLLAKASLLPDDQELKVLLGKEVFALKSIATDEAWDLALLEVQGATSLAAIQWPETETPVKAGDLLIARDSLDRLIWNVATDEARPVTKARSIGPLKDKSIVSKHRAPYPTAIRHALPIDADDAGTAVFDKNGQLVGMHIARFSRTMGLIIPTAQLEEQTQALLKKAGP